MGYRFLSINERSRRALRAPQGLAEATACADRSSRFSKSLIKQLRQRVHRSRCIISFDRNRQRTPLRGDKHEQLHRAARIRLPVAAAYPYARRKLRCNFDKLHDGAKMQTLAVCHRKLSFENQGSARLQCDTVPGRSAVSAGRGHRGSIVTTPIAVRRLPLINQISFRNHPPAEGIFGSAPAEDYGRSGPWSANALRAAPLD